MITSILHVGVTVTDLDRSIRFYRDTLGLAFQGELTMEGEATEKLFGKPGCRARVAYLNGSDQLQVPPVELIQFTSETAASKKSDLFSTSISEICFLTDDLWREYRRLLELGVEFLSEPQDFDFTADGFGKSRAVYFKDPDGIILELMEAL